MRRPNFASTGKGTGEILQEIPLIPGQQGSTTGAATIDTSDMTAIWIFGACNVYVGTDTTHTLPVVANEKFAVQACASIHVSAAVKYTWV